MADDSIKFKQTLADLIDQSGFSRKKICEEVNITTSALSQYLRGTATPGLPTLIAFADLFHVSLDFLVRQTVPTTWEENADYAPFVQTIQRALRASQRQGAWRTELVNDIGHMLAVRIDEVADAKAADIVREIAAGIDIWPDPDLNNLEKHSRETKILTIDFRYDLLDDQKPGAFFQTVVQNIRQGRTYQFLFIGPVTQWGKKIATFRTMLPRQYVHLCEFRCTKAPEIVGFVLYRLDRAALERDQQNMSERLQTTLDEDGWVGYVMSPGSATHADLTMDRAYTRHARDVYETLWQTAEVIA